MSHPGVRISIPVVLSALFLLTALPGGCPSQGPSGSSQLATDLAGDGSTNGVGQSDGSSTSATAGLTENAGGSQPNTDSLPASSTGTDASGTNVPPAGESATVDLTFLQVFPPDNPWNQDISALPVHPNSAAYISSIGASTGLHPDFGTIWDGAPIGIPYVVVPGNQPKLPVQFDYADESDPGPYPIPPDPPIEGGPYSGGDRHILMIDTTHKLLYELYAAYPPVGGGTWTAGSGAIFDLTSNVLRPKGWTSADAAGLPIFAGLVRYDEVVERGEIKHALRFTVPRTQRAFISPARHFASSDTNPNLPPMGLRLRLKASFDITGFTPHVQVILRALQKYGMFVADNGSAWYISGAPDMRWDDDELHALSQVKGRDFEAVYTGEAESD